MTVTSFERPAVELETPEQLAGHIHERPWRVMGGRLIEYSHRVITANGIRPGTILTVDQESFAPDDNPESWLVREHYWDESGVSTTDMTIIRSSVDAARRLWLQIAQANDVSNWPSGQHPAYHQLPYDQTRIEAMLRPDYTAQHATWRMGMLASHQLEARSTESISQAMQPLESTVTDLSHYRAAA